MPKASVIIPVYNVEKYLRRCVDSVLAQTLTDLELILVDDGSTDGSSAICDEYAEKDARVQVIHKKNGGVSSARNDGIDAAVGESIVFVDSDDYVEPTYLEVLLSSSCDLCICGSYKLLENGVKTVFIQPETVIKTVSSENFVHWFESRYLNCVWGKAFRRDIIEAAKLHFVTDMNYGEDTVFTIEYISHCKTVAFLEDELYCYVKYKSGTLSKILTRKSVISYHLLDVYLKQWFKKYHVISSLFNSANYATKRQLKWAFFCIYESKDLTYREKHAWYKLFFSLPTFNDNIEIMFAEYPKKMRVVLHTQSALAVILFQMLARGYGKVKRK